MTEQEQRAWGLAQEEGATDWLGAVQRFAKTEVVPHLAAWEVARQFDRSLYGKAAEIGLLGLGYPEALGGTPASWALRTATSYTFARTCASGGVCASLFSHNIALPPLLKAGTRELIERIVPPMLRGQSIGALAITEPSGGSDVARLQTNAVADGGDFLVTGEKVFITSGMRADWFTVAVRTGDAGHTGDTAARGASGISLLMVPGNAPGVSRTPLEKMGWHSSDTAHLHFDAVRVPRSNLVGAQGEGFGLVMRNFNGERLAMAALAVGFAQACLDEALAWAQQRATFGAPLVAHQAARHKLVDMQMRIAASLAFVQQLVQQADAGDESAQWVAGVCMAKNHCTQTMQFCADQAVQLLGGMGYMQGTVSERVYREVKVMMIGGGTEDVMKDLVARQMGWA